MRTRVQFYIEGDEQHFFAVAKQVAAHEAKLGHGKLAGSLVGGNT